MLVEYEFSVYSEDMGSEDRSLSFHMAAVWLSEGRVLWTWEMRNQMKTFHCGSDSAPEAISVVSGGLLESIVSDILSHFQSWKKDIGLS